MYPKNNASPERIAVGAIYQISDGAIQTAGASVRVMPQGGAAGAGGGTLACDSTSGIWHYIPTQAETNYTSFMVLVYKASCTSASATVVTTAESTAGTVKLGAAQTTDITGSLSGSVGSVTGAVGSVTGSIGGDILGNVDGTVQSVTGAVGSVTGNVGGNVAGSVGSISGVTFPTNFGDLSITASSGRVDVGSWLGTAVTTSSTTAKPEIDVYSISDETGPADKLEQHWGQVETGTAQAGSTANITLAAGASATNDYYIGDMIYLTGGTGAGQSRQVQTYNGSSKVAVVNTNWAVQPDATSVYAILPGDWILSVVAQMDDNVITAAAIATDAVDADALAADAIAEINATVDAALSDIHLDHLLAADYDPASKPGTATALLNELIESDAGVSRFTANALEQAPSGGGTVDANVIQINGTSVAGTGSQVADAFEYFFDVASPAKTINDCGVAGSSLTAQEVWEYNISAIATAGYAGTILNAILADTNELQTDDIPTLIASLPTAAENRAEMDSNSTQLAAIVADTNELQTNQGDWATATSVTVSDKTGFSLAADQSAVTIGTVTTVTNMRGTDNAATAAELAKVPKSDGTTSWNATALAAINAECDTAISDASLATAASLAAAQTDLDTITDTGVTAVALTSAAIADVWSTDTLTESYAADGAAGTPAQLLYLIQQALTEMSISGTTVTIKKVDKSTTAATLTLDDGTTPTSKTRAT